jgi:prolyl oligopeptidase
MYRSPKALTVASASEETEPFRPIPIPDDAKMGFYSDCFTIRLRSNWCPPGQAETFPAGTLLAAPVDMAMCNDWSRIVVLFCPTAATSLQSFSSTKDYIVLQLLQDVASVLQFFTYLGQGQWKEVHVGSSGVVPKGQTVSVSAVWPDTENSLWLTRAGYLVADQLELADASDGCQKTVVLKNTPSFFDSSQMTVDQFFATSNDGTRIPYFVCRRRDIAYDGQNCTLLDAYGGFEISHLPIYAASVGVAWLSAGGVKVIANIRGGGEYGPLWHQAAKKENVRHITVSVCFLFNIRYSIWRFCIK